MEWELFYIVGGQRGSEDRNGNPIKAILQFKPSSRSLHGLLSFYLSYLGWITGTWILANTGHSAWGPKGVKDGGRAEGLCWRGVWNWSFPFPGCHHVRVVVRGKHLGIAWFAQHYDQSLTGLISASPSSLQLLVPKSQIRKVRSAQVLPGAAICSTLPIPSGMRGLTALPSLAPTASHCKAVPELCCSNGVKQDFQPPAPTANLFLHLHCPCTEILSFFLFFLCP